MGKVPRMDFRMEPGIESLAETLLAEKAKNITVKGCKDNILFLLKLHLSIVQ